MGVKLVATSSSGTSPRKPQSTDDWMQSRRAQVKGSRGAQAAGHDAWSAATRSGHALQARTPNDVVALGARVLRNAAPRAPAPGIDWDHEFVAGARGARDALTFGLGECAYAGALALADATDGADLSRAFGRRIAAEQAQDKFEANHYRAARTVGQVLGTGAQIAVLGPTEGLFAGGARIAEATPLIAREIGAVAGVGGAAGVGGQAASDLVLHRRSSLGDYAGAALGGAAGGLTALGGRASNAGAVDGSVTSAAQDVLNGRAISIDRARDAALTGGLLGAVGGIVGRKWASGLKPREKGDLGEAFSEARTLARGDRTVAMPTKKVIKLKSGGSTIPDQLTKGGEIVESKFGPRARLSKQQIKANRELPRYRVDHSLPQDVGVVVGTPASIFGLQSALSDPGAPWATRSPARPTPGARR
jgi:hypothetical protein